MKENREVLDALRLEEHVHGHLGWLAAAALAHPAVLLRRSPRRAHLAVALAVGAVTLVAALGIAMYAPYRERLRQPIFQSSPAIGYLFERKEHLAFGAVVLAWTGAVTYAAATWAEGRMRESLGKASHRAFVLAAAFALAAAVLGTLVAVHRTF